VSAITGTITISISSVATTIRSAWRLAMSPAGSSTCSRQPESSAADARATTSGERSL